MSDPQVCSVRNNFHFKISKLLGVLKALREGMGDLTRVLHGCAPPLGSFGNRSAGRIKPSWFFR